MIFFIKAYVVGTHLNCIDKLMQFKWVLTTSVFKKSTGCNLKTMELLDIGVCAAIRLNTVPHVVYCNCAIASCHYLFLIFSSFLPQEDYASLVWPFLGNLIYILGQVGPQLAFYINLHRAVIGPSATLTGR